MKVKRIISAVLSAVLFLSTFYVSANASGIGACTHVSHGNDIDKTFSAADATGLTWVRDEILWHHVEAVEGQLSLPQYASWVDRANEQGIKPLVLLCYGNPIYSAGHVTQTEVEDGAFSNCALPVRDGKEETTEDDKYFDAYIRYVDFVSKELKGKVGAYEIWNEPDIKPFNAKDATASKYAELLKESYETIKKNDPDVIVIGGVLAGSYEFLEEMLETGVGEYMDAMSFHYYMGKRAPEEGSARYKMDKLREIMCRYGLSDMPMYLTETGYANSDVDEITQAKYIIRNAVIYEDFLADNGIEGQYFSYELHDSNVTVDQLGGAAFESSLGLVRYDYSLKAAAEAVKMYNVLTADKKLTSFEQTRYGFFYTKSSYTAKFTSGEKTAYVIWSETPKEISVTLPETESVIYDLQGNVIERVSQGGEKKITATDSPIFIEFTTDEGKNDELTFFEKITEFFKELLEIIRNGFDWF